MSTGAQTASPIPIKVCDIVQADPNKSQWGPCLVVVSEVKAWGIQGYTSMPRQGDAYIRLKWGEFEPTGGRAIWVAEGTEDDGN